MVKLLRKEYKDKPDNDIDGETWYKYFSTLVSKSTDKQYQISKIEEKLKDLEKSNNSFTCLDFKISVVELNEAFGMLK